MDLNKCECGSRIIIINNMEPNKIVHSCVFSPKDGEEECNFKHVEYNDNFSKCIEKSRQIIREEKIKKSNFESYKNYLNYHNTPEDRKRHKLYFLIKYFIAEKYHSTFQEIELICKDLEIPPYDNSIETIYEFTQRILDTLPSSSHPWNIDTCSSNTWSPN